MFSSENNSYPLYYHQSQSFGNAIPESNNILFQHHHHHHGKYNNYILPPTYPPISENPLFKISSQPSINQESMMISYPFSSTNRVSNARRTAGRKDRHTKIRTAQGVRDRRVRLSMSIAREFFNLQDMLGFDKASKTLGWLLSKSKVAIDELASTTSSSNVVTPPSEGLNGEEQEEEDDEVKDLNDGNLSGKKRKTKETNNPRDEILDKEFKRREKARERARERTRNKKIIDQQQQLVESLNHLHRDMMIQNPNSAATPPYNNAPSYNGFISKGVNNVGESVFLKGNQSISSGSSFDYNYEMISSKDEHESYDSYTDYINKSASESCNYGGILQPPGFEYQLCFEYHQSVHRNSYQC